ncbi:MAG TPA: hypothetical protein VEI53_08455, partial [Ktedonobacteraceae bacterium]|nr:hypothetical protein [Ktedonobacteraceae bacterium]
YPEVGTGVWTLSGGGARAVLMPKLQPTLEAIISILGKVPGRLRCPAAFSCQHLLVGGTQISFGISRTNTWMNEYNSMD